MATNAKRSFIVSEYVSKANNAINRLKTTQQPGQCNGTGSKNDVLLAVRGELQALLADGYTSRQIAEAFSVDVFSILPKTITQLVGNKRRTARAKRAAPAAEQTPQQPSAKAATTTQPAAKPLAVTPGAFNVTPDSEDL
jgi:hypothetical protein